jgi:hypothetical protein
LIGPAEAQLHRVAKALHRQRIGRNAGQPEEIRFGAKRQHKLVVPEPVIVAVEAVRDGHLALLDIDRLNRADKRGGPRSLWRNGLTMVLTSRSLAATSCSIGVNRK